MPASGAQKLPVADLVKGGQTTGRVAEVPDTLSSSLQLS